MILYAGLMAGCDKSGKAPETAKTESTAETRPETTTQTKASPGIEWFKGSVDDAFAKAKSEHKPLFVYWGAVWCPPCEEVKNTVFKSEQFIALTKLFIPVYIDGDSERAQAIGERFGVKGYPTMIVFNPAGKEITRIPGGIDISKYNSILQLSLNRLRPTSELVHLALTKPETLQPPDFTQLAYYSWDQDNDALPGDQPDTFFKDLSDAAAPHDKVAAARLYMEYLVQEARKLKKNPKERVDGAYDALVKIFASNQLVLACWDSLSYWPEITNLVSDADRKMELEKLWQARMMTLRHDPSIVPAEQLAAWLPLLHFHFEDSSKPLSRELDTELEMDISEVNRSTDNPFARQAVVDQIAYIYQKAKKTDEAKTVLLAELDKAAAPWYFMSDLGSLAEDAKQPAEAIKWYRDAYDTAKGPATRFQWGAAYVRSLIRLDPAKHQLILDTAVHLFDEFPGPDDVFTGRNFRVLRSLSKKLDAWKTDSTSTELAKRFTARINELCGSEAEGTQARKNCESLESGGKTS